MEIAQREFLAAYPGYAKAGVIDELRCTDYARLDRLGHIYLDYTGGSLYAVSQLRTHQEMMLRNVFGNPHSDSSASRSTTAHVERARAAVLDHFHASPEEYQAIFTPNATGALKHAGESYPFAPGGRFLLPFDNHNSVNGIREFARARGAAISYVPVTPPDLRMDRAQLALELSRVRSDAANLFAFPAQSNFSGVQHPLELIDEAHAAGWDVLLDAAAFVGTNRLDLGRWKPDLVAVSFYKMFGYPTGVGCLLMRRRMIAKLRRPWFAGGTVRIASVQGDGFYRAQDATAYEDGTVDFLSIPAVEIGLRHLDAIGVDTLHERVRCLTGWTLDALSALKHRNGRPLIQMHGPARLEARGGTVAFNLFDLDGTAFDIRRVEELAGEARISLRTGCFCNPGAGEAAYGLGPEKVGRYFQGEEGMTFDEMRSRVRTDHGIEVGAVRISLGIASNFADVFRFVEFARGFLDRAASDIRGAETCPGSGPFSRNRS